MPRQSYINQKDMLKNNLARLFEKYSPVLPPESEAAKALLALVNNGKKMLDQVETVYIGFFPDDDSRETQANYHAITSVYDDANAVIQHFLVDEVNLEQLTMALNRFGNETNRRIPSASALVRVGSAFNAFSWALLAFGGLYLVAIAVCPPLALLTGAGTLGIGACVGYNLLGIVAATMGIIGAVRPTMAVFDCGYKSSQGFKNTLFSFKQKLYPAPAEQGADHRAQPHI